MAGIFPFRAIRPPKDKVHLVVTRTYASYPKKFVEAKLSDNPYTFVHVINPEFGEEEQTKPNTPERFKKIKKRFSEFIEKKYFMQDKSPCFYIYRQVKEDGTVFNGIIGNAGVDDYFNGVIKIHEQTLTHREDIFKEYLKICDFNAEPILITYPDNSELIQVKKKYFAQTAEYDFAMADRLRHQLWVVNKPGDIKKIKKAFEKIPAVYIADGHHRSASSALLGKDMREAKKKYTGKEGFNFFMCLFVAESNLKIADYNRIVSDLNGLSKNKFLKKISEKFLVLRKSTNMMQPAKPHFFSMYLGKEWYLLKAKKKTYSENHPVESLDTFILMKNILSPILGIRDQKTDKRLAFIHGPKGLPKLRDAVDSGKAKVAFALCPMNIRQVKKVADAGLSMPPKSTWIEPKLRSALTVYSLSRGV